MDLSLVDNFDELDNYYPSTTIEIKGIFND
jgi:hypothetical protein